MSRKNLKKLFTLFLALGVMFIAKGSWAAESYEVDKVHSSIGFSVLHLMVSKTNGAFNDYDVKIVFDPNNLAESSMEATIKVDSIDTKNTDRDKHLKSPDFFDAEKFSEITFKTTEITSSGGDQYALIGNLTIHGVTKKVSLPATIAGPVNSPFGFKALGINSQFKLNRQDYGISWNKQLDNGGALVSDEVDVAISLEAHRPTEKK